MRLDYLTAGDGNAKTAKSATAERLRAYARSLGFGKGKIRPRGIVNAVLHLAPYDLSGRNVCPFASAGCAAACLNTAGRGGIIKAGETTNAIQLARIRRTHEFFADRKATLARIARDIARVVRVAVEHNALPAIRLNGTSDIAWHTVAASLFTAFPDVQFYDYTKDTARMLAYLQGKLPPNYHLTFSLSETNAGDAARVLAAGGNVAAVFHKVPPTFMGVPVVDGDADDFRFLDPRGVIVGLKAKGKAKKDTSGFVQGPAGELVNALIMAL